MTPLATLSARITAALAAQDAEGAKAAVGESFAALFGVPPDALKFYAADGSVSARTGPNAVVASAELVRIGPTWDGGPTLEAAVDHYRASLRAEIEPRQRLLDAADALTREPEPEPRAIPPCIYCGKLGVHNLGPMGGVESKFCCGPCLTDEPEPEP